ncbi:DgyrCDS13983 [Dimorphilus gyrociliatus]|uniref:DgyrCDS13983 n=1 Tax=Dimorphilus gyrociliatus TaxID=2664684 RepID=A0A7I8WC78_9ANNE|nr:DgyrCDS13983 [Dimorphilus gyrociliatus]
MAQTLITISEEFTECTICLKSWYENDPKQLECGHTFCRNCLQSMIAAVGKETLACPTCRFRSKVLPGGVDALTSNRTLKNARKLKIYEEEGTDRVRLIHEEEEVVLKQIDLQLQKVKLQIENEAETLRSNVRSLFKSRIIPDSCWFRPENFVSIGKVMKVKPFKKPPKMTSFVTECVRVQDIFVGKNAIFVSRIVRIHPQGQSLISKYSKDGQFIRDVIWMNTAKTCVCEEDDDLFVSDYTGSRILRTSNGQPSFSLWVSVEKPLAIASSNKKLFVSCPYVVYCFDSSQAILWHSRCNFRNPFSISPTEKWLYLIDNCNKQVESLDISSGLPGRRFHSQTPPSSIYSTSEGILLGCSDRLKIELFSDEWQQIDDLHLGFKPFFIRLLDKEQTRIVCSENGSNRIWIIEC